MALVGQQHAERREMRREQRHDHASGCAARARSRSRAAARRRRTRPARNRAGRSPSRPTPRARRATSSRSAISTMACAAAIGVHAERLGDLLVRCRARAPSASSFISPPRKLSRIEPAEHDVGVGDRRLGAAAAIADRAGLGARAVRTDLERADVVDPGDASRRRRRPRRRRSSAASPDGRWRSRRRSSRAPSSARRP